MPNDNLGEFLSHFIWKTLLGILLLDSRRRWRKRKGRKKRRKERGREGCKDVRKDG